MIEVITTLLDASEKSVWLKVGTLIDGISERPLKNAHLVYNREKILFLGKDADMPPRQLLTESQQKPDLELDNYYLLPGLIEAHAHLFLEGSELDFNVRKEYLAQGHHELLDLAKKRLDKLVKIGIAGIRDAGDKDGVGLALSRLYQSTNRPLMPYVESPGAAIHHAGRYGSFMAEPLENFTSLADCVQSRIDKGADRIKLIPTGIINFKQGKITKEPQMTLEEIRQLVQVSKSFGKQTFAHASGDEGIERVIEAGVDSVEHGFFIRDDQLSRMRDRQIAWIPTFAPVQKQVDLSQKMGWDDNVVSNLKKILYNHSKSLVKASEMGVQVIAGSDAGSYGVGHGTGLLYELELMEKAGLKSTRIINSATGISFNRLDYKEKIGHIQAGFKPRFILTSHSPLDGIANLAKNKWVVFDGRPFESKKDDDISGL